MFETSVVRVQAQTRSRFSLLSASLAAHSAIILGAIALSIASVDFPRESPRETARFLGSVRIPPPLGNPNGGAKPKPQPAAAVKPAPLPTQPTAPLTIPETIADVPASGASESSAAGEGTEPGPRGVPWGEESSIGDLDAPPVSLDVPVAQPEAKIYQPHEVKAPVLISKQDPRYPPSLMRTGMAATVVVRCVIDKDGNIRDPQVIMATMPPFEAEVLRVLPQWRYRPATYAGRAVDSYLDLTVSFRVQR